MASEGPHTISVPASVRFPLELDIPSNFDALEPATWPRVEGRLEYVSGRLLYLPPCGLMQQATAMDVGYLLRRWSDRDPEFLVGGLEAGMVLGKDARGGTPPSGVAATWGR